MFYRKGIVINGPVCSAKTKIIEASANVLKKVFKKTLKHSTISPSTFTLGELMGSPDEPNAFYSNECSAYESIFSLILKGYDEM